MNCTNPHAATVFTAASERKKRRSEGGGGGRRRRRREEAEEEEEVLKLGDGRTESAKIRPEQTRPYLHPDHKDRQLLCVRTSIPQTTAMSIVLGIPYEETRGTFKPVGWN